VLLLAETITGSLLCPSSFFSILLTVSFAAIGFEMNFDLMLLFDRRSPRWKIDFHECVFRLFQLLIFVFNFFACEKRERKMGKNWKLKKELKA
jgi:hypothetical protein